MKHLVIATMLIAFIATLLLLPAGAVEAAPDWTGTVTAGGLNVRPTPDTTQAPVGTLRYGDTVTVVASVKGEAVLGSDTWYQIGPGQYVVGTYVARKVSGVAEFGTGERWIDVDLSHKVARAMVDDAPVYTADVTIGRTGSSTPVGRFSVLRRVANEIMDSSTIGIPRDSPDGYYLTGVLYTQYFLPTGQALHYNYWVPDSYFGQAASSRGCIGLRLADAKFFWDFADVGTTVNIHY